MRSSWALPVVFILLSSFLVACGGGMMGVPSRPPPPQSYAVEGRVTDANGVGIEGVQLVSDRDSAVVFTGKNGRWSMGPLYGNVVITPVLDDWIFEPTTRTVTDADTTVDFHGRFVFTPVEGIINTDTEWTVSSSPYKLTGAVAVAPGTRLTIEQGVRVYGGHSLFAFGEVRVEGTAQAPVALDNIVLTWGESGDRRIHVEHAIVRGGGIASATGTGTVGMLTLRDSQIVDVDRGPYLHIQPDSLYIERNVFIRSQGILVFQRSGKSVDWPKEAKVYIRNNVFVEQPTWTTRGAVRNEVYDKDDLVVKYNSFLSTDRIALSGDTLDAIHNFWNTTDPEVIESMIDGFFSKTVYEPFLEAPHPDTPGLFDPLPGGM